MDRIETSDPPIPLDEIVQRSRECKPPTTDTDVHFRAPAGKYYVKRSGHAKRLHDEAMALVLVRELTSIPVPQVVQITYNGPGPQFSLLATEFIHGRSVRACWSELGIFTKLRLIWTLRGYIAQLRTLRRAIPGPVDPSSKCAGAHFSDDGNGPFTSHESLISWWNRMLALAKQCYGIRKVNENIKPFVASGPLVFTHQDLGLNNLFLGDDGRLYVVDWEWAGFYPLFMEYLGIQKYEEAMPWLYRKCIPFLTGQFNLARAISVCLTKIYTRPRISFRRFHPSDGVSNTNSVP